jgi:peptidoglycan hydrolase-like protein with peptidoglycan-binding domain
MQEHLASAEPSAPTTGVFDSATQSALTTFQTAHGLPASGQADPATWQALLALTPVAVDWTTAGPGA